VKVIIIKKSLFCGFIATIFAFALVEVWNYKRGGQIFPLLVAGTGLLLAVFELFLIWRGEGKTTKQLARDFVDIAIDESIPAKLAYMRALRYLLWILAFYLGIWFMGVKISVILFFVLFLKLEGETSWKMVVFLTGSAVYLVFFHFEQILSIHWPEPFIARWVKLPWLL
jgi:hypothetical protein